MSMKNLNIFRRLDELETANLHLQVMLKSTRLELEALKSGVTILHNAIRRPVVTPEPSMKRGPKPKVRSKAALDKTAEKKREYARRYYAKKKAAKAAA